MHYYSPFICHKEKQNLVLNLNINKIIMKEWWLRVGYRHVLSGRSRTFGAGSTQAPFLLLFNLSSSWDECTERSSIVARQCRCCLLEQCLLKLLASPAPAPPRVIRWQYWLLYFHYKLWYSTTWRVKRVLIKWEHGNRRHGTRCARDHHFWTDYSLLLGPNTWTLFQSHSQLTK